MSTDLNKTTINEIKFRVFSSANKLLLSRRRLSKDWADGFEAALSVIKKELEKAMKEADEVHVQGDTVIGYKASSTGGKE